MWVMKAAVRLVLTAALVCIITAILLHLKLAGVGPHHPVFFYLPPIAFVAMVFGSLPAVVCAAGAALCSAFFLYDPVFSFYVQNTLEWGDLICFAVLALMAIKCAVELSRPSAKSRYARP